MSDNLEKFVTGNRDKFNVYEPPEQMWGRIERDLIHRRWLPTRRFYLRIAAIAAIVLLAFIAGSVWQTGKNAIPVDLSSFETGEFAPMELKDAEAYFARIIDEKMVAIEPIIEEYPGLREELQLDFSELDAIYSELKHDLKDNISNQEVIKAIVENYRFRINILEDMLVELEPDTMAILLNDKDYEL